MSHDSKKSSAPFWCAMVLGAALLYPASLGPWVYAASRFDLPAPVVAVAEKAYWPIEVAVDHILPAGIARWYMTCVYWWMALSGNPNRC